ncbi:odorant-binding protein 59a [Spodoptera frugiperda]|uniref:Odorant-binding protein 59a n=1 Tax=Spodoptera frugiperda TaxID=7108 RepID=A0A9R0D025_SPOFR|nr:odorant-binding protein 59a [Spodoptera frugiperda]
MVGAVALLALLPALVAGAGEGNIKLLEDEVAVALKSCTYPDDITNSKEPASKERQRRSEDSYDASPRIDDNVKEGNRYSHERRISNDSGDQLMVINATDDDYSGYGSGNMGEKLLTSVPRPASPNNNINKNNTSRTRRNEPLLNRPDSDQCLSQCVFANLQVVDSRGIPREAELWNKVQSAVTSQQSRSALHDQIRACFQELQSEAEDNGCSYSNKLERCLMLRFADRKVDGKGNAKKSSKEQT